MIHLSQRIQLPQPGHARVEPWNWQWCNNADWTLLGQSLSAEVHLPSSATSQCHSTTAKQVHLLTESMQVTCHAVSDIAEGLQRPCWQQMQSRSLLARHSTPASRSSNLGQQSLLGKSQEGLTLQRIVCILAVAGRDGSHSRFSIRMRGASAGGTLLLAQHCCS